MSLIAAAGLALLCGFSIAQIQGKGKVNLQDTSGNSKIQNGSEFVFERLDDGRISFEGSGGPIYGTFKKQGLTLETARIEGIATTAQKTFSLASATLSGKVHAVLTRPSATKAPNAVQQIDLSCPKADYLASAERWTLAGPVSVHRQDLPAKEDFELSGAGATVLLYGDKDTAKGDVGLRSVTMSMATLKMKTNRKQAKERAPSEFEFVEFHFNGTAESVVFDDQARTITFRGNVHFWGDDPLLVGDMTGDSAVVTLDAKGQPKRISMSGEPGVTKINQKPPPEPKVLSRNDAENSQRDAGCPYNRAAPNLTAPSPGSQKLNYLSPKGRGGPYRVGPGATLVPSSFGPFGPKVPA